MTAAAHQICFTCQRALCDCTDAAWRGAGGSRGRAASPPAVTTIDLPAYFHNGLGIALIGLATAGKARRVTHRSIGGVA
jgi:hypothetical protein